MGRNRKPKHKIKPQKKAAPRTAEDPRAYKSETLRWSFHLFDETTQWYDYQHNPKSFNNIAGHLKSSENRTWAQIEANAKRDHTVPLVNLIPAAQARLEKLRLDDSESLLRLRFNGKQRIWGFREGRVFKVLWWDPQHKICPSSKKHT